MANQYQVRCWDEFFQNWCMIPEDYPTEEQAVARAIELSDCYDCGENGSEEMQVYIDVPIMGAMQMIGYVSWNDDGDFVFEEAFC